MLERLDSRRRRGGDGGDVARVYAADADEDRAVTRTYDRAEAELGLADVVVYNVGIRVHGPIIEQNTGEFEAVWRVRASAA